MLHLSGLSASRFADENEGLVVAEGAKELLLLLPHGERASLLEDLKIPRRVWPPVPPVDGGVGPARGGGGAVGGAAAELGGDGGLVDHVEEAHLPLPLRPHGGESGAAVARWPGGEVGEREGGGRRNPSLVLEGPFDLYLGIAQTILGRRDRESA